MLSEQNIIEYRNLLIRRKGEAFNDLKLTPCPISAELIQHVVDRVNDITTQIEVLNYIIQTDDETFNNIPF